MNRSFLLIILGILLLGIGAIVYSREQEEGGVDYDAHTMVIGVDHLPGRLEPFSLVSDERLLSGNIFESLIRFDRLHRPLPSLALSWGIRDLHTWEIRLRPGVQFQDGSPLTVDDVAFSLQYAQSGTGSQMSQLFRDLKLTYSGIGSVFQLHMEKPDPLILTKLTFLPIVSKKARETRGEFIGTGPYEITTALPDQWEWKQFAGHWDEKSSFERVLLVELKEKQDRVDAAYSGKVDFSTAFPVSEETLPRLGRNQDLDMIRLPGLEMVYLFFHLQPEIVGVPNPLADSKLREALSYGIPVSTLVDRGEGNFDPINQFLASGVYGYLPNSPTLEENIDKARELIGDKKLTITISSTPDYKVLLETLSESLPQMGVVVVPQILSPVEFQKKLRAGTLQAYVLGWKFDLFDAQEFFATHIHSKMAEWGLFNGIGFQNDAIDQWIEQSDTEMNEGKRLEILRSIQKKVLDEHIGVPLFETKRIYVKKKTIDWKPRLDGFLYFHEFTSLSSS